MRKSEEHVKSSERHSSRSGEQKVAGLVSKHFRSAVARGTEHDVTESYRGAEGSAG
jgi:hypothetical protein